MGKLFWMAGVALSMGALAALVPSATGDQAPGAKGKKVPTSLEEVGEFGENVYDLAKASDWPNAKTKFDALKASAKQLGADLKNAGPAKKTLDEALTALERAVGAKDRLAAMREANQVTRIAADLIEPFNPPIPATVTRLDYFGRELEIWSATKDKDKLKATGDAMRKTWDGFRATLKARGGDAEAKRFDELMTKVGAATSVDDYARLVTPILDEVDNMEKVFKK